MRQIYFFASVIIWMFFLGSCMNARPSEEYENFLPNAATSVETDYSLSYDFDQNETFESFVQKFSADSLFQVSRIEFPLRKIKLSDGLEKIAIWVEEKDWWRIIVEDTDSYTVNYFETYKNQMPLGVIEVEGIENGINLNYYFKQKNGSWFLTEVEDLST